MRWIYLSPHLDDAILSCGGLIHNQVTYGLHVEIWTIFAGKPPEGQLSEFAHQTYTLWGFTNQQNAVRIRKNEDKQAAALLGAGLHHFRFLDCIFRRSPTGGALYPRTIIASPHPDDHELPAQIAGALQPGLRKMDALVCPLSLGGHVDHILVRNAAESLNRHLLYYADVPYILNTPEALEKGITNLMGRYFKIPENSLEAWLQAISLYRSQLLSLYKGEGSLFEAVRAYWSRESGLRLWEIG